LGRLLNIKAVKRK